MQEKSELATRLQTAIDGSHETVDSLADRTKVPRTTILALIEEPVAAVLPERVYLRGHLKVLGRSLGLDTAELVAAFDEVYPVAKPAHDSLAEATQPVRSMAVSAGLYGIAIIAVALAFVTALS